VTDFDQFKMKSILIFFVLIGLVPFLSEAGPLAYGICQSGCNAVVVAWLVIKCYDIKFNSIVNNISAIRSHLATPEPDLRSALLRLAQEFLPRLWAAMLPWECVWQHALQLD
jgi:hypothetical protein